MVDCRILNAKVSDLMEMDSFLIVWRQSEDALALPIPLKKVGLLRPRSGAYCDLGLLLRHNNPTALSFQEVAV